MPYVAGAGRKRSRPADADDQQQQQQQQQLEDQQPKRARLGELEAGLARSTGARPAPPSSTPCHICHRKPSRRSDPGAYADCEGCGRRTCFVCIRGCRGWPRAEAEAAVGRAAADTEQHPHPNRLEHPDALGLPLPLPLHSHRHQHPPPSAGQKKQRRPLALLAPSLHRRQPDDDEKQPGRRFGASGTREEALFASAGRHRARICSRCCLEHGSQGDVICLGCLSAMPGAPDLFRRLFCASP